MSATIPNGNQTQRSLRIGVVGGGLVGSAAVLALSHLPNIEVTAFEKSPVAREAGAWISLTVTGLKVLSKLIPPAEISRISYRPPDRAVYVTRHWRTGEILVARYSSESLKEDYIQARTHREPLLKLILSHLPEGSVQYGQRVVDVVLKGCDEVELQFDGVSEPRTFDLVVAADGLYSKIRRKFWPDHVVGFKGAVAYRTIFPKSRVDGIEGLLDDSSAWRKDGEVFFLSELGLDQYGVVIIRAENAEYASTLQWEHKIGAKGLQRLRDIYKDWDGVIARVLDVVDDLDAYPLDSGPWLKQLIQHDRVAFVGDAAHPTAGAYGAGAAMGHGDAWALYKALQATSTHNVEGGKDGGGGGVAYDVPRALRIFQEARLPFLTRVEQQMAVDKEDASYIAQASEDEAEWTRRFKERNVKNEWLTEHDVELEVQKAIMGEPLWSRSA
ncbi:salicylate hydroxylase [Coniochaeta sp. 2T2.1]|nr:salicylate hydroxylase [Coniochaeta sp. 2T2.1]